MREVVSIAKALILITLILTFSLGGRRNNTYCNTLLLGKVRRRQIVEINKLSQEFLVVEPRRIELPTSALRTRRSPS